MHGTFHCVAEDGEPFDTPVPLFASEAISHGPSGEPLSGRGAALKNHSHSPHAHLSVGPLSR